MQCDYELVDFGRGRKLESFAGYLIDRPSPAADGVEQASPERWPAAAARYERAQGRGVWQDRDPRPEPWNCAIGQWRVALRLTDTGQTGLFPEQQANWEWIGRQCRRAGEPLRVLNLFAYTGASTLAAAAAGAEVTHLDASRSAVAWARQNAALSALDAAPIRWIVDDARRFVDREVKRGRRYHAVVLDPPSYGHGAAGEPWRLTEHLGPLLAACRELTKPRPDFMLLTCHTPGVGPGEAAALLAAALESGERRRIDAGRLSLKATSGAKLDSGVMARWSAR